jgi:hypothetical protein
MGSVPPHVSTDTPAPHPPRDESAPRCPSVLVAVAAGMVMAVVVAVSL